jgi:hypothetical protein
MPLHSAVCSEDYCFLANLLFCRVVENGVETVTVEENGHVVSRTIDGVPQATDSGCS